MAKFYIGQPVRVAHRANRYYTRKAEEEFKYLYGKEGFVNELDTENIDGDKGLIGVTINGNPWWCFPSECLEPILLLLTDEREEEKERCDA